MGPSSSAFHYHQQAALDSATRDQSLQGNSGGTYQGPEPYPGYEPFEWEWCQPDETRPWEERAVIVGMLLGSVLISLTIIRVALGLLGVW